MPVAMQDYVVFCMISATVATKASAQEKGSREKGSRAKRTQGEEGGEAHPRQLDSRAWMVPMTPSPACAGCL